MTHPSPRMKTARSRSLRTPSFWSIEAATQQAVRAAYKKLDGKGYAVDFTTADGHRLGELTLEDAEPELCRVDG